MDRGLFISNHFGSHELEGNESSPEIGGESPPSSTTGLYGDHKTTTASQKRSRSSIQKRVVSIPIKDLGGSRLKGESAPLSDSWAWRKYGQKPIKGSPYPRGYYRCSSSKGCPARKQVERSRLDPTMLVVTYSCEHNHSGPTSQNSNHGNQSNLAVSVVTAVETLATKQDNISTTAITTTTTTTFTEPDPDPDEKFRDLSEESLAIGDEFGWFADMASMSSSTILGSPIFITETSYNIDTEMTMFFPMIKEEDESLFADLGELPDCSRVFRRGLLENEEVRQCTSSPWCGTT